MTSTLSFGINLYNGLDPKGKTNGRDLQRWPNGLTALLKISLSSDEMELKSFLLICKIRNQEI